MKPLVFSSQRSNSAHAPISEEKIQIIKQEQLSEILTHREHELSLLQIKKNRADRSLRSSAAPAKNIKNPSLFSQLGVEVRQMIPKKQKRLLEASFDPREEIKENISISK